MDTGPRTPDSTCKPSACSRATGGGVASDRWPLSTAPPNTQGGGHYICPLRETQARSCPHYPVAPCPGRQGHSSDMLVLGSCSWLSHWLWRFGPRCLSQTSAAQGPLKTDSDMPQGTACLGAQRSQPCPGDGTLSLQDHNRVGLQGSKQGQ